MDEKVRNTIMGFLMQEGPPCDDHYQLPDVDAIKKYAEWPNDRRFIGWRYYWDKLSDATEEELISILLGTIQFWEEKFWIEYNKAKVENQ